jgi:hypothetical protein
MKMTALLVVGFAALLCLDQATAQVSRPARPVMFKCVDTKGKTYYSDKMLPNCAKGTELSSTGRVIEKPPVKVVAPDPKVLEANSVNNADQERRDRALMATYTTVEEIDSARDRTLALPMQGIKTAEARLARARSNLSELKKEAEVLTAKNKPIPAQLTDDLAMREREVATLESELAQRKTNIEEIQARYDADKVRFHELKEGPKKEASR